MESRAKLFAHPVHKMLVVFPLALFTIALFCDAAYITTREPRFAGVAYWAIVGGILGCVLAAVVATRDWMAIPRGTRAKAIGLLHGIGSVVLVTLFVVNWIVRFNSPDFGPPVLAVALTFGAVALGAVSTWPGVEIIDRLSDRVDGGAALNAPASLSSPIVRA
jgi:uncharacterized membrane protein